MLTSRSHGEAPSETRNFRRPATLFLGLELVNIGMRRRRPPTRHRGRLAISTALPFLSGHDAARRRSPRKPQGARIIVGYKFSLRGRAKETERALEEGSGMRSWADAGYPKAGPSLRARERCSE